MPNDVIMFCAIPKDPVKPFHMASKLGFWNYALFNPVTVPDFGLKMLLVMFHRKDVHKPKQPVPEANKHLMSLHQSVFFAEENQFSNPIIQK